MQLIKELRQTNSNIDKQQVLRNYINKGLVDTVLMYTYNPHYRYYMKLNWVNMMNLGEPSADMFTLLDKILCRDFVGDKAREMVTAFSAVHGDLIKLIINKSLDCGISSTTVNKVQRGLIPQFKVQLAKEVPLAQLKLPLWAQLKYDGVRLIIRKNSTCATFTTRNGMLVNLPYLAGLIEASPHSHFILDGEITIQEGTMEDRTKVSGMINSAMKGGVIDESNLIINIFDSMKTSEFDIGFCPTRYENRLACAEHLVMAIQDDHIQMAITTPVETLDQIQNLYDAMIDQGYEGLVLKHPDHLYTFKRSKDWVKMKEVRTTDLECVGILYGEGKYEGMIGALICTGLVEGTPVTVNVGSGLSDTQRDMEHSTFTEKTIEVKYNSIIRDSVSGDFSLFLPRFVEVRIDK